MTGRRPQRWAPFFVVAAVACASPACKEPAPPPVAAAPPPAPAVPLDRKLGWIIRLEQQRTLRDPDVAPRPRDASAPRPASFKPADAADLETLALDPDPGIRTRAVTAIGRVGMTAGVPALRGALADPDADVRAASAFGLGLLGPAASTDIAPLEAALRDDAPAVRARAADALGLIGDASAVPALFQAAGNCRVVMASIAPDDEQPASADAGVCRAELDALVRLNNYDAIAAVTLDGQGQPASRWWPVAYALARVKDPRALPALEALATGEGVYGPCFALRGLADLKDPRVIAIAAPLALRATADIKLRVAAVRALGTASGTQASAPLLKLVADTSTPQNLLLEAITALGGVGDRAAFGPLADLLEDAAPSVRAAALSAAAKVDRDGFLVVLAGLGRDSSWIVRAALAGVLATLPAPSVTSAIEDLVSDPDARVHGPALEALAAIKAPSLGARLFASLEAPDFVERATAARLVGAAKLEGGAARLAAAYDRGASDAAYAARAAAIEGLAAFGADAARATLHRALADRDWPVRVRAAELLHGLGEPGAEPERPAPVRRPEAFFESAALLHPQYLPQAFIETSAGTIKVELDVTDAPMTSQTFLDLARSGFFAGMPIHRVVPGFVVQAGDPRGDGEGGPGYTIPDELSPLPYLRGTMGMALDWHDTGGSQWFIAVAPAPHLDARYTAFGHVIDGADVLDRVTQWDVIDRVRIWDGVTMN